MIRNLSRKTVLASKSRTRTSIWTQMIGLMFSIRDPDFGMVFYFKKNLDISIHNFFVFYSLDLLFLDENKKVVEIKQKFLPFAVYFPKNKFKYVVEVVAGKVRQTKTCVGDRLDF